MGPLGPLAPLAPLLAAVMLRTALAAPSTAAPEPPRAATEIMLSLQRKYTLPLSPRYHHIIGMLTNLTDDEIAFLNLSVPANGSAAANCRPDSCYCAGKVSGKRPAAADRTMS